MIRRTAIVWVLLVGCGGSHPAPKGGDDAPPDSGTTSDGAGPVCLAAETACTDQSQCCTGLYCDDNSLGHVCCGGFGTPCATADGTDCCGPLACADGVCGGAWDPSTPHIKVFPVRGMHNVGYEAPSTGSTSSWSCNDANSNSDFVPVTHLGNDIWATRGTPVAATVDGTLAYTGYTSYSGNKVTIVTSGNWYHFFCHLDSIAPGMVNGVHVTAGQIIGYVGNTGTASNGVIHLHYSIYPNDNYDSGIDPWPYLHEVEWHTCE